MSGKKVLIAGGTGTLGTYFEACLSKAGFETFILSRQKDPDTQGKAIYWDPAASRIELNGNTDFHTIINITGATLDGRWTQSYKKKMYESRIKPARFLRELLWKEEINAGLYIGASAEGIYGDTGDAVIKEKFLPEEEGFLTRLVKDWEAAHLDPLFPNTRTLILRFGIVFNLDDGFIPRLLGPANFGMFPYFGKGQQWLSWIHINDLAAMMLFFMQGDLEGTFNAVAKEPVRIKSCVKSLKNATGKPGIVFSVPENLLKILFGEMSTMILKSCYASPECLLKAGFRFQYPTVDMAFQDLFGQK